MSNNNGNYYPGGGGPGGPYRQPSGGCAPLVLGIIALLLSWMGYISLLSIVLAVVGLFMAIRARNTLPPGTTGKATAAMVLCILALVISLGSLVSCVFCYNYYDYNYWDYYYWW